MDTALQSKELRTGRSSQSKAENPKKLTERNKDHVQLAIEENGPKGHQLNWSKLVDQFGFDVHPRTLRSAMVPRGYFTFVAASKPYVTDEKVRFVLIGQSICLKGIHSLRIGTMYAFAMKFISAGVQKANLL